MAERRTIENWGARLNVAGEPLTMEEAMLLNLGHQNSRMELMLEHLEDMRMRLTRLELFLAATIPGYDATVRQALGERQIPQAEHEGEVRNG